MGLLVDGKWQVHNVATTDKEGKYDRIPRTFRDHISSQHEHFKPESNRYHLYVSYACPWAHRTLIYRELKHLQDHISVSVVSPDMLDDGWIFDSTFPESTPDHLYNSNFLRDIYIKADSNITTSVTVPILWDKKNKTIVNNESSEIIRILNSEFNEITGNKDNYSPDHLLTDIDKMNEWTYENINNGVYKVGFAKTQKAYDSAVENLFNTLDQMDSILEGQQFLVGDTLTEADIRLLPTLLRFDIVYYVHFKCSYKKISEYKNLSRYLQDHYKKPAIRETTNFDHIKRHYYYSHNGINPYRIVPKTSVWNQML